jgi:predicted metal-dependent hydrolase
MSNKLPDIRPRRVRFSWEKPPLHWVPGDPTTTQVAHQRVSPAHAEYRRFGG